MTTKKPRKVPKRPARSTRPKLLRISEEMRQWSDLLEHEIGGWPGVTSRPMFGLTGFYRKKKIFAALPRTRALGAPNAIIFKFDPMPPGLLKRAKEDPRMSRESDAPGSGWCTFEINSADELRDALWWLNRAHQKAEE